MRQMLFLWSTWDGESDNLHLYRCNLEARNETREQSCLILIPLREKLQFYLGSRSSEGCGKAIQK